MLTVEKHKFQLLRMDKHIDDFQVCGSFPISFYEVTRRYGSYLNITIINKLEMMNTTSIIGKIGSHFFYSTIIKRNRRVSNR